MDKRSLASHVLLGLIAVAISSAAFAQTNASSPPAPVEASNVQFFIGQRVWLATWDQPFLDIQIVLPNPASPVPVIQESNRRSVSGTTALPLTSLGIRYKDWTAAVSVLPQIKFSTDGIAVGDTVRRDETDLSLSYSVAPSVSTSLVYKTGTIDQVTTANAVLAGFSGTYKVDSFLIGVSGNASVRGPLAVYGNFAFGPARQTVFLPGLPNETYFGTYFISEVGLAYRLTEEREFLGFKNLSAQFGYRTQSVTFNELPFRTFSIGPTPTLLATSRRSVQSVTQGLIVGLVAAF